LKSNKEKAIFRSPVKNYLERYMKPNGTYHKLINEADAFFNIALKEYKKGKKEKDDKTIRQGAEKAWNAAVQATLALAVRKSKSLPRSYKAQFIFLNEFCNKNKAKINGSKLDLNFSAFAKFLHGECFYFGNYELFELDVYFNRVAQYIDIIKNFKHEL